MLSRNVGGQNDYEDEYGAFNLSMTVDMATPIDIAGDLENFESCRKIIDHFL